jgi:hypothetical protein
VYVIPNCVFMADAPLPGSSNAGGSWRTRKQQDRWRQLTRLSKMYRLRRGRGFVDLTLNEIEADPENYHDPDRTLIVCVPLARFPSHNPVYLNKPGYGGPDQLLYDVGLSPDGAGLVALDPWPLDRGAAGGRDFICTKVRLHDDQEGWINVAMRDPRWPEASKWRLYFKLVVLDQCFCDRCELAWLLHGWHCPGPQCDAVLRQSGKPW